MRIVFLSALVMASLFGQRRGGAPSQPAPITRPSPPPVSRLPISRPPISRPVRPNYPRTIAVPYPVFIGGGYYEPVYASGYADPSPIAVVNPNFQADGGNLRIVDYSNVPLPEAIVPDATDANGLRDDQPTIFLIALTDHTVVAAIAYWVEGDTLNWVSREAQQNHMSVSLVDRDFSKQLNAERHVEFRLPPAN
jgi:hypothetical protein